MANFGFLTILAVKTLFVECVEKQQLRGNVV
jgi:hypothetical protein